MILTIIYFVFILGVTVFIHELGHFMFAKKFGVYVYEFSIGMGPRLFKFNRKNDETDYCIRLFPIGGYVQMAGEEVEVDEKIPENKRLQSKKWYQRLLIMVAGVMMNFILAIVILFTVGLIKGVTIDARYITESNIDNLKKDDKIIAVNDHFVNNYDKLALELAIAERSDFTLTVSRGDKNKKIKVHPIAISNDYLLYGYDYGFTLDGLKVEKSDNKNIEKGYEIIAIDGHDIETYYDLINILDDLSADKKSNIIFTFKDNQNLKYDVNVKVKKSNDDSLLGYDYGFEIGGKSEKGVFAAIKFAFFKFFSLLEQMLFTIFYLCTGVLSLKMLSGPVGIFTAVGTVSSTGFINILFFLAIISVNVGFINLLPIPAFDGGHVLFIIIEKIKGSPVNQKVENTIHTVFLVLLMILMLLITFNDILKLF
ncbi:MAG: RIP metalloprotease RseP [Bacilli bacterium]|nr:RIP metalloprotease RseP [Bacilli bacterium]